jgi:hypothetical protein
VSTSDIENKSPCVSAPPAANTGYTQGMTFGFPSDAEHYISNLVTLSAVKILR